MNYNKQLKSMITENQLTIDGSLFKRIEFVNYALNKVIGNFDVSSANLYFTQYQKKFNAQDDSNSRILYMLRKKFHQYYSKKQLLVDLDEYLLVPEKYRYFSVLEGKVYVNSKMMVMVDRVSEYEELIEKYSNLVGADVDFLSGQGAYDRVIRLGEGYDENYRMKKFEFDLDEIAEVEFNKLPEYREKTQMTLPLNYDWSSFKQTLKGNWASRPSIQISSCNEFDNQIDYKGNVHIVGLLGAGKSTYIIQETVRLLGGKNIKIGIIEPNVSEVIKTLESLKELGINAAPIIGASQLKKHRERFMNSRFNGTETFNDIIDDKSSALDYLSGYCILSHYANDYDITPAQYPCNQLKKDGLKKNYSCPLFNTCGYFGKFIDLVEADVWVTTAHSLLASKANAIIDPYKRTYYELFHDCLDIVFVDEADSIQEDFDNRFMADEVFYGGNQSIMKKFQKVEELLKNHRLGNIESETHRWIVNFPHLTQLLNRMEYLIVNSYADRKYLIEATITPRNLFNSIIVHIVDIESEQSRKFINSLESFLPLSEELRLNEQLMSHELFMLYDKLTKCPNVGNASLIIDEMIEEFVNGFDLILKKSRKVEANKLFKKKLELFIYIVLIDYYFRIQNSTIDNLASKLPEINSIFSSFKFYNKEFIHLMSESVIGNVFGYKLLLDDENRLNVHLFNYSGIGRSLIEEWSIIKKELGKQGPAIVMLSGTSYAPASAHFHIAEEPTFILSSDKKEGKIEQFINRKYNSANEPIKISGISDQLIKREKLIELTKHLINDIKYELKHWRSLGKNRSVLLIVNSYEQCRIIGDYLQSNDMSYKVLSNNKVLKDDEINTSQIEMIPSNEETEILVAPLSIISRGYNIIDDEGNSYFGSAFFMIRPYISPDDLTYNYRVLNSIIGPMMEKCKKQNLDLEESMNRVRKFAYSVLNEFNEKKFWKHLDEDQRAVLAWYTFIPVKQAVGRMQRNGCSCRVFYCDSSFVNDVDGRLTEEMSMLKAWENNLIEVNTGTGNQLYGEYLKGLSQAIRDFEIIDDEEDMY